MQPWLTEICVVTSLIKHTLLLHCRYWLSVGAQPSEPVQRLLFRTGLLPPPPMLAMGRKGGPRDARSVDPMTGRVLSPESPSHIDIVNKDDDEVEEEGKANKP